MRHRAVVLASLSVCWLVTGGVVLAAPAAADIDVQNTVGPAPEAGVVDVTTRVTIPEGTTSLEVTIPAGADVHGTEGFRRVADHTYEWTGGNRRAILEYTLEGNVTVDRGAGERHLYAVTGEWAIVRVPGVDLQWVGPGDGVERTTRVDGEGVAGESMVYLGGYEEHVRDVAGQRLRLVVPAEAELREEPEEILAELAYAAERLEVGERDPEVFVVAAPTTVEWAVTGLQRGDADAWVRDAERLDSPRNAWVHEYVHTRQTYERTSGTLWTAEGMAEYYAALFAYERDRVDYRAFRDRMALGADYDAVRLAEPGTWSGTEADYIKGALVFAHLDRRLRTEANASIDAVVSGWGDEVVTEERFLEDVEAAGGTDVRRDAERYTRTTAAPELPTRAEHVEAFGGPRFRYSIETIEVSGPYRETGLEEPRLVTGETLTATVRIENTGDREGSFDAAASLEGEPLERVSGTLAAGETTTRTVEQSFEETGEFDLAVGTARTSVVVDRPAGVSVADLEVVPAEAAAGEPVRLRATVEPSADRPAEGDVRFAVGGEIVGTERVRTAGPTTVGATTRLETPGEHTVRAGGRSSTLTVREATTATANPTAASGEGSRTPTAGDGAGFGPGIAVVTLAAALVVLRRRGP